MGMWIKIDGALASFGAQAEFRFRAAADALDAVPDNAVLTGDITVSGTCANTGRAYRIEGAVRVLRSFVCDRCLDTFAESQVYPFGEDFVRGKEGDGAEDGVNRFFGDAIDITPLVRDTILTAQPMRNLCRADCRGLCPRCGADLNQGDCGCERRSIDPRLAALTALLQKDE